MEYLTEGLALPKMLLSISFSKLTINQTNIFSQFNHVLSLHSTFMYVLFSLVAHKKYQPHT